jgi:hypothetical protein
MSQTKKVTVITDEISLIVNDEKLNLSQKIRTLYSMNIEKGDISRIVNRRYQHVRNVLNNPPKKA